MGETFEIEDSGKDWESSQRSKLMFTGKLLDEERVLEAFRRICGGENDS